MSAALLTMLDDTNLRIAQLETQLSKERATKSALVEQLKKVQKQQVADVMDGVVVGVKRAKTEEGLPEVKQELAESVGEKDIDDETSPTSDANVNKAIENPASVQPIRDTYCSPPSPEEEDNLTSAPTETPEKKKRGRPTSRLPPGACLHCTRGYGAHAPTCERSRAYKASLP